MSGIAGIYYLDGAPAVPELLQRMNRVQAHRGPDGSDVWCDGSVGLAHCMLHTTPESTYDCLPAANREGTNILTAQLRIDNRDELIAELRLRGTPSRPVTDVDVVLAAYERWGEDCPSHLLGDFAFALWDGRRQQLFCARDHFGVNPLYYVYKPGRLFAFGSEIKALFCVPGIEEEVDDEIIGEYLNHRVGDVERTIFRGVLRLPPGHSAVVSEAGVRSRAYWQIEPATPAPRLSDDEYAEQFLGLFREAVRCRLRSMHPVGAELSGGLDSSLVTCVARDLLAAEERLPLHTISLVYDRFSECDERAYITPVVDQGGIVPHYVPVEQEGLLSLLDEIFKFLDDGRASGNHHLNWLTARAAQHAGVRVLLTGQDGDTTVSHGWQYFIELANASRWDEFAGEADRVVANLQQEQGAYATQETFRSARDVVNAYATGTLRRWAIDGNIVRVHQAVRALAKHFAIPPKVVYRHLWRDLLLPRPLARARYRRGQLRASRRKASPIMNPLLAERHTLAPDAVQPQRKGGLGLVTVRGAQLDTLRMPEVTSSVEKFGAYAAAFGIEVRHPFFDKRLIEYCMSLPPDQSLKNGWTRVIMRRAMEGIVPKPIQWRSGKANLEAPFRHLLLHLDGGRLDETMENIGRASTYLDVPKMEGLRAKAEELSAAEIADFGLGVTLVRWLGARDGRRAAGTYEGATASNYVDRNVGIETGVLLS